MLKKLSEPLNKEDVELRIGSTNAKGFSLLLYKTARTDVKRLNESGAIWKNRHFYDDKGLLCCEISIFNNDIKDWVSRSDVGVESFTEKEKGSYSDSFKRAGFRWGIGLELYNAPFIWINWNMRKRKNSNSYTPENFFSSNLEVTKYEVVNGEPKLEITYNSNVIYSNFKKVQQQKPQLTNMQRMMSILNNAGDKKQVMIDYFLKHFEVEKLEHLQEAQVLEAIAILNKKGYK